MPLAGTTVDGDIDLGNGAAHLVGGIPGIPGLGGELIEVNQVVYYREYGQMAYQSTAATNLTFDPASREGPAQYLQGFLAVANDGKPQLVGTEQCEEGACYHIKVVLEPKDINNRMTLLGDAMGTGNLDIWILQSSFRVARMEWSAADPEAGSVAIRLLFTKYDAAVNITAPTAEQLAPEPTP